MCTIFLGFILKIHTRLTSIIGLFMFVEWERKKTHSVYITYMKKRKIDDELDLMKVRSEYSIYWVCGVSEWV